jgi:hypothetical protein
MAKRLWTKISETMTQNTLFHQVWGWHIPIIPVPRRWRLADGEFEATLVYISEF